MPKIRRQVRRCDLVLVSGLLVWQRAQTLRAQKELRVCWPRPICSR